MRTYGSIHTKFWTNTEIQKISDKSKLLAVYLLSSSHTNMLGCFRIPIGYVAEDLKWNADDVIKALDELIKIDFLSYDKNNSWLLIHHFLKYQPIENPNQAKSIAKLFEAVSKNSSFIEKLIANLLKHNRHFDQAFSNCLESISKPFRNQEQDQEPKQEQEECMSGKPDIELLKNDFFCEKEYALPNNLTSIKQQAEEILQFLNDKTNRAYRPVETNLKLIMARLKSGATVGQCFQVIAKKTREWKGDAKMDEYLRPATLFNAMKFEQYVGELVMKRNEERRDA